MICLPLMELTVETRLELHRDDSMKQPGYEMPGSIIYHNILETHISAVQWTHCCCPVYLHLNRTFGFRSDELSFSGNCYDLLKV